MVCGMLVWMDGCEIVAEADSVIGGGERIAEHERDDLGWLETVGSEVGLHLMEW